MELDGRVVMVTGAASGIGKGTAELLARRGADLVLADVAEDALRDVATQCEHAGVSALPVTMDQRTSGEVDDAVASAYERFGRIDALANIAGIYPLAPYTETTDELFDDVLQVNLAGTFYCCRAVIPRMVEHGGGSVINTASGSAFRALTGAAAYSASKAGIVALTRVLAQEAAPTVRVNTISPGPIDVRPEPDGDPHGASAAAMDITLGRWGRPADIAEMVAFLASERSSFITGQVLHVNGGRYMS